LGAKSLGDSGHQGFDLTVDKSAGWGLKKQAQGKAFFA